MSRKIVRKTCVLCGTRRRTTQQSEEPYTCRECEQMVTRQFMKVRQGEIISYTYQEVTIISAYEFMKYMKKPWWAFWVD